MDYTWVWSAFAGTGGVLNSGITPSGAWTFLAVVYDQDASSVTLYVDGASFTTTGSLGDGYGYTYIGDNPDPYQIEYFYGVIDNVFFFDEALSSTQIATIREYGVSAVPLPPSALLLGSGLLGLLALGCRRRRD